MAGDLNMANDLEYHHFTVCWHEDLGKFPNCLNSIPNENLGLKKENKQFFLQVYMKKKFFIIGRKLLIEA